ncbi:hypothetical protein LIA77_05123 [Sarocladium implicatum]|nr:hypothetical protein LIA77_05123 [Sarocladium implicatum]
MSLLIGLALVLSFLFELRNELSLHSSANGLALYSPQHLSLRVPLIVMPCHEAIPAISSLAWLRLPCTKFAMPQLSKTTIISL